MKDYDHEILYHPGKEKTVAIALIHREVSDPIYELCLRMTVVTLVLEMIRDTQSDAIKEENRKSKRVVG